MNRQRKFSRIGIGLLACAALVWLAQTVSAAPQVPLSRTPVSGTGTATSATATATPVVGATAPVSSNPGVGAILLKVTGAPPTAWTMVQWQDGLDGWHDVDGWQGDVDDGQKLWAVLEANFGQGPFRWVVYEKRGGKVWGASAPFDLPEVAGQQVNVTLEVNP